jgi:hypothetical protein
MENSRFKFRVWDKRYSEYYYDVENSFEENIVLGIDYFGQYLNDDDFIVEQSTGLKDKNGKLIFENDLIKVDEDGRIFQVVWMDGPLCWGIKYQNDTYALAFLQISEKFVVGNTRENPELLEDK